MLQRVFHFEHDMVLPVPFQIHPLSLARRAEIEVRTMKAVIARALDRRSIASVTENRGMEIRCQRLVFLREVKIGMVSLPQIKRSGGGKVQCFEVIYRRFHVFHGRNATGDHIVSHYSNRDMLLLVPLRLGASEASPGVIFAPD